MYVPDSPRRNAPLVLAWDMDKHMAWRGFSNIYKSYID